MENQKTDSPSDLIEPGQSNINWRPLLIIFIFVLVGLVLAGLNVFYRLYSPNQGAMNNLDQQKLSSNYIQQARQTIGGYLAAFDAAIDLTALSQERVNDLVGKTKQAQEKMLSLVVPATAKDFHLQAIILLGETEKNLADKKFTEVNKNVTQLRDSLNKIN